MILVFAAAVQFGTMLTLQPANGVFVAEPQNVTSPIDESTTPADYDEATTNSNARSLVKLGDQRFAHRSSVNQVHQALT